MRPPKNQFLNWELWPLADKAAWCEAVSRPSFLSNPSPIAYWSPKTQHMIKQSYGYWLTFLRREYPGCFSEPHSRRVTVARVIAFSDYLGTCVRDSTRIKYIRDLHEACRSLDIQRNWKWFADIIHQLRAHEGPPLERKLHSSVDLFWLGVQLMEEASVTEGIGRVQYRDGLLIAMLAVRPVRMRNIAGLNMDEHLVWTGRSYRLQFTAAETKTQRALAFNLPKIIAPYIGRYLVEVRPNFPDAALHHGFWPTLAGGPMKPMTIYSRIRKHTLERLGYSTNVHGFRYSAAATIASKMPERVADIPAVLGNRTHGVVEKYYNLATTLDASQRYRKTIEGLMPETD